MPTPLFVQARRTFLKAPITDTETGSILLGALVDLYGNQLTMADFGAFAKFTFNPGATDEEDVICTDFTVNSDGSVELDTGIVRGVKGVSPYTAGGTANPHYAGTVVVVSNSPYFYQEIINYVNSLVFASAVPATDTQVGYVKVTPLASSTANARAVSASVSEKATPDMALKVNQFAVASLDQSIIYGGGTTPTITAPVTNPRIDLIVYASGVITVRTGTEAAGPVRPTPTNGDIVLASVYNRVGETKLLERDDSTNGYIQAWYNPEIYNSNISSTASATPTGSIVSYSGRTSPTGWLLCDGSAVSRATYAALLAVICPSQTMTVTIASPGVVTATAHGLVAGDKIHFTTTGGLPSGISTNTDYFVLSASIGANTFEFALSPEGTPVVTTGSQSGVHTLYKSAFGKGDGSTTFNVPDMRSKSPLGLGQGTETLKFESGAVDTGNDWVTIPNYTFPSQGQAVVLTTTGALPTGLSLATTYYIIRLTSTTIGFAVDITNANAGNLINLTAVGSGVTTMTFTNVNGTVLGHMGGEETHLQSVTELAAHNHTWTGSTFLTGGGNNHSAPNATAANTALSTMDQTGGNTPHNNMSPYLRVNYIIKI